MRWPRTLRLRFMMVVLLAAVIPLVVLGVWLTGQASRSGQALLVERMDHLLENTARTIGGNWLKVRAELLAIGESTAIQTKLAGEGIEGTVALAAPGSPVVRVAAVDLGDRVVWSAPEESQEEVQLTRPLLLVRIPVYRGRTADEIGSVQARLSVGPLMDGGAMAGLPVGAVLSAIDPGTGASLLGVPFDRNLLQRDHFRWAGEDWVVRRRPLGDPPLQLVAAAPVSPLTEPFEHATGQGLLVLGLVAALSILVTWGITGVMTRSLNRLSAAAESVARGELEHTIAPVADDEIGRVARAFNSMTMNLRRTLRESADRQSLAAVGEFAASLSHEVRNALSSIRIDLQVSGEKLPDDPEVREPQERALREILRLQETVSGTLELARGGKLERTTIDLWDPIQEALAAGRSEFESRGARLLAPQRGPAIRMLGDAAALQQLFLNLFLNAAQALEKGGTATVRIELADMEVTVRVEDTGPGIPPEIRDRVMEPFFSTRSDGTGLGLPIAGRIARVHGGHLRLMAPPDGGTAVEVMLPTTEHSTDL